MPQEARTRLPGYRDTSLGAIVAPGANGKFLPKGEFFLLGNYA